MCPENYAFVLTQNEREKCGRIYWVYGRWKYGSQKNFSEKNLLLQDLIQVMFGRKYKLCLRASGWGTFLPPWGLM